MKTTLALVALFVVLSLAYASACSCTYPLPPWEALGQAGSVFIGRVTGIAGGGMGAQDVRVTFDVSQVFKGIKPTTITVSTEGNSATCGYGFEVGGEYIVYASDYNSDGVLSTSICTRTKLLSLAQEDLAELGNSTGVQEPVDGMIPPHSKTCDICGFAWIVIIAVLVAAVVLAIYFKKIRKQKVNKK